MRQLALLASASPSGRSIIFKLPQEIYTTLAKTGAPARQVTRHSYMNGAPPVTLPVARIAHTDEWAVPSIRYRQPRFSRMKIMECGPATGATGSRPGLRYRRGPRERPQSPRGFLHCLERRGPGYPHTPSGQSQIQETHRHRLCGRFSIREKTIAPFL